MSRIASRAVLLSLVAILAALWAASAAPAAAGGGNDGVTVRDLLRRTDDLLRGASSHGRVIMRVQTESWQRELELESWSEGTDKTLVRILAPAKERGTATLKVGPNIWNYLPKVDRTIKVPASMMSASWMGSHFTNDDLVRESRFEDDYSCSITERPANGAGHWTVECSPHPEAPVVWGKVVLRLRPDELVEEVAYFDEHGRLARTMTYGDVADFGGRRLPRRLRMTPADKPGEYTEVYYQELAFDVAIPADTFSLQGLRR
jgi:hypothetical protein